MDRINNTAEHSSAIKRIEHLMLLDPVKNSKEYKELEFLVALTVDYERSKLYVGGSIERLNNALCCWEEK